jgi:4-diphosphocytidyl-2-C-methyl-D-erythritol kinase
MAEHVVDKLVALASSLKGGVIPVRAPAKVNLRLKVVGRRDDGYHLLSMLNCTTSLCDELGISFPSGADIRLTIEPDGVLEGESVESNLVVKAFRAFWRAYGIDDPPVGFFCSMTKKIPIGGGLGGGSSDAGAVLRVLSSVFGALLRTELGISQAEERERVLQAALSCGADVPYAYIGGLCWVSGVGERVRPLSKHVLSPARILILVPSTAVNTKAFYDYFRRRYPEVLAKEDPSMWQFVESLDSAVSSVIENDFEPAVCELAPSVGEGLALARRYFPATTSLTGSGSAFFSLVPEGQEGAMSELSSVAQGRGFSVYPCTLSA